ncbi:MAG TPA: MFS transporter [Dehalococcoidia bacterium]|nr:MFS transporter [Dehalococcoidia bacterium]
MGSQLPIDVSASSVGMAAPRGRTFAALAVPHYPQLWLIGFLWNLTRWMSMFLSSYLVNQLTHSPFLVQLVGTAFFAPMFLVGAVGGVISDRLDRRRTMLTSQAVLLPIAAMMAAVNLGGVVQAWMAYPFMLAIGAGMVVEMTSRRALVYDLVGRERVTNALALESIGMTGGTLLGGLAAGAVISVFGIGHAFFIVACLCGLSLVLLLRVPTVRNQQPVPVARPAVWQDLKAAFSYVRGHGTLVSVLGITIIMNLFYFSFTPMVPVFADELGVNAFRTGVLASAPALGSLTGTLLIAHGLPLGRGRIYFCGSMLALVFLCVFAAADSYPLALAALALAGFGTSGFATMQSVLVMITTEDEMRGRAMGLLSMSIGSLPFSMLILGGAAEAVGPSTGVTASVLIGLVLLVAWTLRSPEAQRIA